ncbi:MAG: glycosyltransferase family 4 protein [Kosmotoga sp.]|nr:MAG: glycosyltransferase family 4 protein [Kosmotoga sp.]
MKVLLYSDNKKLFRKSGIGVALEHQMLALNRIGVDYTLNPKEKYDVAHINTIGPGAARILNKSKKEGIPVIYHCHTTEEDFKNSFIFSNLLAPLLKKRLIKLYSKADFLLYPTKYTERLIRSYKIDNPGEVVSNGVDTALFTRDINKAVEFRKDFGIEKDRKLFISVGYPFKRKGVEDFVEIAKKMPDATFIWFGSKIKSILPKEITKIINNPPKNVQFPGYLDNKKLLGAYSASDAFLFPSYEENEGIAVLEALSTGNPVIVRDIPVFEDWLINEYNCLKCVSIDSFVSALKEICKNELLATKLSENARQTAKQRDLALIGKQLKNIYLKISGNENENKNTA